MFERLTGLRQAGAALAKIDRNTNAALLCINDDVGSGHEQVAQTFREWQERHWGTPAAWERT